MLAGSKIINAYLHHSGPGFGIGKVRVEERRGHAHMQVAETSLFL
jgi:hypothetical protein